MARVSLAASLPPMMTPSNSPLTSTSVPRVFADTLSARGVPLRVTVSACPSPPPPGVTLRSTTTFFISVPVRSSTVT